jgi:hypothetical protein
VLHGIQRTPINNVYKDKIMHHLCHNSQVFIRQTGIVSGTQLRMNGGRAGNIVNKHFLFLVLNTISYPLVSSFLAAVMKIMIKTAT